MFGIVCTVRLEKYLMTTSKNVFDIIFEMVYSVYKEAIIYN